MSEQELLAVMKTPIFRTEKICPRGHWEELKTFSQRSADLNTALWQRCVVCSTNTDWGSYTPFPHHQLFRCVLSGDSVPKSLKYTDSKLHLYSPNHKNVFAVTKDTVLSSLHITLHTSYGFGFLNWVLSNLHF